MSFICRRLLLPMAAWTLALGVGGMAGAQAQTVSPPKPKADLPARFNLPCKGQYAKQSLPDILHVLMTQCKINVLVDGNSVRKEADFNFNGSVAQALDTVSDAFDCDWSVNKRGIVLLRRRFSAPDELPQMHLAEMQQMTADIFKALRMVNVDTEFRHQYVPLDKMIGTLTPEQRRYLLAGNILKARDMPADQQALLEEALVTEALNPAYEIWEEARSVLRGLPFSYITSRNASADSAHPEYTLLHIAKEKGMPARTTVLQNIFVHIE
jgi:hypothetical protein